MKDPYLLRIDNRPLVEPKTTGERIIYQWNKMESIQQYIDYANGKQDVAKYKKAFGIK